MKLSCDGGPTSAAVLRELKSVDNFLLWISPGRISNSGPDYFHDGSLKSSRETIPPVLHLSRRAPGGRLGEPNAGKRPERSKQADTGAPGNRPTVA